MEATQTASHLDGSYPADGNPPTFESVWAAFQEFRKGMQEFRESQKEWQKEHAQGMKELRESQKELTESQKETDRIVKETSKQIGTINNRFGEIVEYMITPNLLKKFREYGFKFHEAMSDRVFSDDDDNTLFEVDVLLQNSDKAMLVETKATLTTEDVREHIERLKKMRAYADLHGDKRIFLGAVAGVVMTSNVKKYALKQGFYVIEPSGETFNIIPPSGKPKEW